MDKLKVDIQYNKNLLAFSAGIDSTALFFLLLKYNISFDIAIVDYNQRLQSKDEVIYATQLAHKYNKKCFISTYPVNLKFSEKDARDFRYSFFDEIIIKNDYETLITAHQLNDKLEWFLMQLTKGAGIVELLGMKEKSNRNSYVTLKPLLKYSKQSLQEYLDNNNIKYFYDESNSDQKYKRNFFRHNFSDKLINDFEQGISNSFEYLDKDLNSLILNIDKKQIDELSIYKYNGDDNIAMRYIDKELKLRGVLLTKKTRDEIIKNKKVVVSHKISVSITIENIYICPYVNVIMDKKFKDRCRINKIPNNIRAYLFKIGYNFAN